MSTSSGGFFASKSYKNIMKFVYGWGAAVVIVGALFKILHLPGASEMLTVGLLTEAIIFILSSFEPIHEELDWSLVYPQLAGVDIEDHMLDSHSKGSYNEEKDSVSQQLDEMLSEAKIGPELIESLGVGLRSLSDQTSKLNDITDVSSASNELSNNLKGASTNISNLSESYAKATESLTNFAISSEDGKGYGEQLKKVTDNLSQLNSMYEMQLKDTADNLNAAGKMSEGIAELIKSLNDSVDDTKKYRENMSELTTNLSALNSIYGNMLNAMNFNKG